MNVALMDHQHAPNLMVSSPVAAAASDDCRAAVTTTTHPKRKVGAGLRRFMSLRRMSKRSLGSGDKSDDTASDCTSSDMSASSPPAPLRSCLKKSTSSSSFGSSTLQSKQRRLFRSSSSSRSCAAGAKKVHWDYSDKNNTSHQQPPPEYRDPDLWWSCEDLYLRRLVDHRVAHVDPAAKAYLQRCQETRLQCSESDELFWKASIESSSSMRQDELETTGKQLKRVLVQDPQLLTGFLDGDFRGTEGAGGPLGGQERIDEIQQAAQGVILAYRNACMYMSDPNALAAHLAEVATQQSLADRCWARLLAVGDELVMECEREA